jgi:hypothetical protein
VRDPGIPVLLEIQEKQGAVLQPAGTLQNRDLPRLINLFAESWRCL